MIKLLNLPRQTFVEDISSCNGHVETKKGILKGFTFDSKCRKHTYIQT